MADVPPFLNLRRLWTSLSKDLSRGAPRDSFGAHHLSPQGEYVPQFIGAQLGKPSFPCSDYMLRQRSLAFD